MAVKKKCRSAGFGVLFIACHTNEEFEKCYYCGRFVSFMVNLFGLFAGYGMIGLTAVLTGR